MSRPEPDGQLAMFSGDYYTGYNDGYRDAEKDAYRRGYRDGISLKPEKMPDPPVYTSHHTWGRKDEDV